MAEAVTGESRVAIAAGGAVTALGLGLERFAAAVRNQSAGLRDWPRLAGRGYQSSICGYVAEEVWTELRQRDPARADASAYLLADAALRQASEELAGVRSDLLAGVPPSRRGLVLSTTKAEIGVLDRAVRRQPCSAIAQRHLYPAFLASDLAAAHEIGGPVECVSVACISGLLAIQQGVLLILEGKVDLVFVVGVDLLSDFVLSGFSTLKSLEVGGCRPFDVARKGLSLGEAGAAIALVRHEKSAAPELLVKGWGSSNDANHLTGPSRDGSGLALAMNRAMDKAKIAPEAVDFVHAHGTGTAYNDAMEGMALRSVFGSRVPPFCSSKGVFGHTLGAAGIIETLMCLVAARIQVLPGTPGLQTPDPSLPETVLREPRPAPLLRHLMKLNAGFGGTNAALVLEWEAA